MAHLLGLDLRTLQLLHARRAQLHQLPPRHLPAGHIYTLISGHIVQYEDVRYVVVCGRWKYSSVRTLHMC